MLKSTITAVTVELIFSVLFDLVGFGFTGRPEVLGMSLALPDEDEGKRALDRLRMKPIWWTSKTLLTSLLAPMDGDG